MKQSSTMMLTPTEIEVIEILVEFPTRSMKFECCCGFPFGWGRKKRRSAIGVTPSPSPPPVKAEASSPATPLSFSPSESDDKNTLSRRNVSLKRKRELYLKMTEKLTEGNNALYGEIKNVKSYFDKLKDFNLKLKARKQELSLGPNQDDLVHEQLQSRFPGTAQGNQAAGPPQMSDGEGDGEFQIQQATTLLGVTASGGSNDVGPIEIPDLNLPLEESVAVDSCGALDANVSVATNNLINRAMAAAARQNRLQICRVKNPIGNSRSRYSCR